MKFNGLTDKEVEESRKLNGSNRLSEVETVDSSGTKLKASFGDPYDKNSLCGTWHQRHYFHSRKNGRG